MAEDGSTSQLPRAAFAFMPEVRAEVFPGDVVDRLRGTVRLSSAEPLTDFGTAHALRVLADTEILVTGWGCPPIDDAVLDAAPRLAAVVHAAGSVKDHVTDAVFARGITVSSAAEANARPVAEYTVAVCVLGSKRAFTLSDAYLGGADVHSYRPGSSPSLTGATVGIIGASRVGRLVIGLLRSYQAEIVVHDPYLSRADAEELGVERVGLDDLCARSHIVSVHAPQTPETFHMLAEQQLSRMREGALVVNTARGSLIDTDALTRHCAAGRLDAVLDVTDPEPLPVGHPLLMLPNVLVTPHIAGAKGREVRRLGEFAAAEVERFVAGTALRGRVLPDQLACLA